MSAGEGHEVSEGQSTAYGSLPIGWSIPCPECQSAVLPASASYLVDADGLVAVEPGNGPVGRLRLPDLGQRHPTAATARTQLILAWCGVVTPPPAVADQVACVDCRLHVFDYAAAADQARVARRQRWV